MKKEKIRSLVDKILEGKDEINESEFETLYTDAVNNHAYQDAIIVSFLVYLQRRMKDDPDEELSALGLLKSTIELFFVKGKATQENKTRIQLASA